MVIAAGNNTCDALIRRKRHDLGCWFLLSLYSHLSPNIANSVADCELLLHRAGNENRLSAWIHFQVKMSTVCCGFADVIG